MKVVPEKNYEFCAVPKVASRCVEQLAENERQFAYALISHIYERDRFNRDPKLRGFSPISGKEILRIRDRTPLHGKKHSHIITFLKENKVIDYDIYDPEKGKCRFFRIHKGCINSQFTTKVFPRRNRDRKYVRGVEHAPYVFDCYSDPKLQIDVPEAYSILNEKVDEPDSIVGCYRSVVNLRNKSWFCTVSDNPERRSAKFTRRYNTITNCERGIRKCLRYDENPLFESDIKSSFAMMILGIIDDKRENTLYRKLLQGDIYEYFGKALGRDRSLAKDYFNRMINDGWYGLKDMHGAFKSHFPVLYEKIRSDDTIFWKLEEIESKIIQTGIRFCEKETIWVLHCHDALYFRSQKDCDRCNNILSGVTKHILDFVPTVKAVEYKN